jgi:hypothetical protein
VPQALVGEVAYAGRAAEPDQVVSVEEEVGEPGGVGGVFGDGELAVALAQGEDLVEREQALPDSGRDDLCPADATTTPTMLLRTVALVAVPLIPLPDDAIFAACAPR